MNEKLNDTLNNLAIAFYSNLAFACLYSHSIESTFLASIPVAFGATAAFFGLTASRKTGKTKTTDKKDQLIEYLAARSKMADQDAKQYIWDISQNQQEQSDKRFGFLQEVLNFNNSTLSQIHDGQQSQKEQLAAIRRETAQKLQQHSDMLQDITGFIKIRIEDFLDTFKDIIAQQTIDLKEHATSVAEDVKDHTTIEADRIIDKVITAIDDSFEKQSSQVDDRDIHNIPYESLGDLFKGRTDELNLLIEQLEDQSQTTAITQKMGTGSTQLSASTCLSPFSSAISGLGGIGKTRLAVEFAYHALQELGYNTVLFVNCSQQFTGPAEKNAPQQDQPQDKSAAERLYAETAKLADPPLLNIKGAETLPPEKAFQLVIAELQQRTHWLLVFDNVDEYPMANAIRTILPQLHPGKVIITSRLTHWPENIKPLPLEKLSRQASIEYLLQKTQGHRHPCDNEPEKVNQLAQKLDGLPVALEQAAAYIIHQSLSFADYLKDFDEIKFDVLGFEAKDVNLADYPESLLRTWTLTEQKLSSNARAILTIAAFLSPDNIPESLLLHQSHTVLAISANLEQVNIELVNKEALLQFAKSIGDPRAIRTALAQLHSFSMITRHTPIQTFSLHRLVQEVTRLRLNPDHSELFTTHILKMIHNDQPDPDTIIKTNYAWHKSLDKHISALIAFAKKIWPDTSALPPVLAAPLATQMNNLSEFYRYHALFHDAEPLMHRALQINEKSFGPDHPEVAITLNNLAALYQATNRLAHAEPLMHRALQIDEKSLGPDHPDVARDLNNLAQFYKATNRFTEAEPLMCRALQIDEISFGPDHPHIARDLNNLAQLYRASNRLTKAEPLMRRALQINEKSFGPDHPHVATALNNLSVLLKETNRFAEAEPLYQRALQIDEKSFGPDHPDVARDLNNLAQLYKATNRLTEAEPLIINVIEIYKKSYGQDHPNVAKALNNLATLYHSTNRQAEAEPLMHRALQIDEKSLGLDHPDVARDLNNLAQLYQITNRLTEAEPLYKRALQINEKALGPHHPYVATALNNLAQLYQDTNRFADAEPLMHRALQIDEKSLGPHHPDVATDLNNLAGFFMGANRLTHAEPLFKRAVSIFLASLGPDHPHTKIAMNGHIDVLLKLHAQKTGRPLEEIEKDLTDGRLSPADLSPP